MYTIYADGEPLYHPQLFNEGCGVLSPKITVQINKAGSLDFTIPPSNDLYDKMQKLKTVVTAFQNGEEIFSGRILNSDKDFYNRKKTYCEGELAYLLDSVQRPYSFSGTPANLLKKYIDYHNGRVEKAKQFQLGTVTVSGTISCDNNDYPTTMDEITDKILNKVGGNLVIRKDGDKRYLDLIASSSEDGKVNTTSQIIEFGVNLLDITEHISAENIFTIIVPLGATVVNDAGESTEQKLTIASVNGGKDYIEDTSAISLFGRIERKVDYSDVEDASELMRLGKEDLAKNIEMSVSLTMRAIDLHILNVNTEMIRLGDWVRVVSIPHKLDKYFQCTKIVYNMESPDQNEYSFGLDYKSLTEQQVSDKKKMTSSVSTVLSTAGAVNSSVGKINQAAQNVDSVISKLPSDIVTNSTFNAYKAEIEEDIEKIESDYQQLLSRVIQLEGGTA